MALKEDLILRVLKCAEKATPSSWVFLKDCGFEGWSTEEACKHIKICAELGWVEVVDMGSMTGPDYAIRGLTVRGHLELDHRTQDPDPRGRKEGRTIGFR